MKITEELWDKYDQELENPISVSDYTYRVEQNYYSEIMKRITKKHVSIANIDVVENEDCSKFFTEDLVKMYDLTPGFFTIIQKSSGSSMGVTPLGIAFQEHVCDEDLTLVPLILFGDDLIVVLKKMCATTKSGSEINFISGDCLLYTSDSADKALSILRDISKFLKSLPEPKTKDGYITVEFAQYKNERLQTCERDVRIPDVTLDEFNEDLPNDKIVEELEKDEAGLFIFHGEPGCGKTSYIKYLMRKIKDKTFIIFSQDLILGSMEKFRQFLINNCKSNSIIIVEDCENLVRSRENSSSSIIMSDILNMTDGIYGDMLRMNFIITFNTEIQKIDQALLRKCRLKCRYKFEKLRGERLKSLAKSLGIELTESQLLSGMAISDLYGFNSGINQEDRKKQTIGFRQ